jgi:hypothetical protein
MICIDTDRLSPPASNRTQGGESDMARQTKTPKTYAEIADVLQKITDQLIASVIMDELAALGVSKPRPQPRF